MSIKDAKSIPLDEFLKRLGFEPDRQRNAEFWYRSPFRNENTASFKLSPDRMAWYDHGEGVGGNIIDLAFRLNGQEVVSEALQFIEKTIGSGYSIPIIRQELPRVPVEPVYTVTSVNEFQVYKGRVFSPAAAYLSSRGIEPNVMCPYLRNISFFHKDYPNRALHGFGIQNNNGGFEIRQQSRGAWLKSSVGHKGFTHFPADRPEAPWFTFEGMPDFGTFLSLDKPEKGTYHYLILNSTAMTDQAIEYLKQQSAGTLIQCPQKGDAGEISKQKLFDFVNENGWSGGDIEYRYEGYGDYNEGHMAKLNLSKGVVSPIGLAAGYSSGFKPQ
jgi:hypothetical protein